MIGFGAFVKSFANAIDRAAAGLRLILGGRGPKPCPIPIPVESLRRGR